ncbi:MAG: SLBB domain-containing protein [Acidobacteria bacterium]|nr:SLBB domain-containing protein [Acidobacteriota bacterium]
MPFIEEYQRIVALELEARKAITHRLLVCGASGCLSSGGDAVREALAAEVNARGLGREVQVKGVGCMGLCAAGPLVAVDPAGLLYQAVTPADAGDIVASLGSGPVTRLLCPTDTPFFTRQLKIVLENSGLIDPERIEDYVVSGGYQALIKVLTEMTPGEVIDQITRSGLRGRGGGGYPTGLKWTTVAKASGQVKYVICNADEGDPGAFMDRSVLESDPHRVLEGMALAGYAVGASHGYVYVRAEYPVAVRRLQTAIKQAKRLNLLGNAVLGTPYSFNVEVRLGAGAFVCGEETALMASIEGRQGTPRPRPPYPAEHGLWGCPTLINNVETFANVAWIVRRGGEAFAAIGSGKSRGTKVFALAGKIVNTGLIEVPMGTSLREIIEEIGGGVPEGRRCKAVQTGGPSGGCIPADHFDAPVDYESLRQLGSMMGSGGMIVMDDSSCMVDVARYFMDFCMTESCGKCVPCRVGTTHIHDLLARITAGKASEDDLRLLDELCELLQGTSLCGLGQSAPNPVLSTLRYFREEYAAHVGEHRCLAGACGATEEVTS